MIQSKSRDVLDLFPSLFYTFKIPLKSSVKKPVNLQRWLNDLVP